MAITVTINQRQLNRLFGKIEDLQEMNFKKPLAETADIMLTEINDNFRQQGAIYQGGGFVRTRTTRATTRDRIWAPLAPATRARRALIGLGARPILEVTGRLRKSFRRSRLTNKEVVITNSTPYGGFHQMGTRKMPQRRIVGFSQKSIGAIKRVFGNHIKNIIER